MIHKLFLIPLFLTLSINLFAQDFNTITVDEETDKPMLIGYTTRDAFNDTSFSWWWNSAYNLYEFDTLTADLIKDDLLDINIKVVMGTWCSDSRTEVPNFYKILDEINYPSDKVTLINVNRDKVGLADEVEGLDIHFVPTFIFSKEDKELGRIVEMPYESLEKDILEILKN